MPQISATVVLGGPGLCEWGADAKAWPGLRSLVRVPAERIGPRGRRQRSVRYYISSCPVDAEALRARAAHAPHLFDASCAVTGRVGNRWVWS